jgi:hypothetical protein
MLKASPLLSLRLRSDHPTDHCTRSPTACEHQFEIEQALEILRVFVAACLMSSKLDAASLSILEHDKQFIQTEHCECQRKKREFL